MTEAKTPIFFRGVFRWLMIFTVLFWVSAVALMIGWPWKTGSQWQADFPLVAVCADQSHCSVLYGELAEARAKGKIVSLVPTEPMGEAKEEQAWLRWETGKGQTWQYEVKRSSWYFETKTRYSLEGESPVLVQYRDLDSQVLILALPIAGFIMLGLRLRSLRR